jgi:hypothetical protein
MQQPEFPSVLSWGSQYSFYSRDKSARTWWHVMSSMLRLGRDGKLIKIAQVWRIDMEGIFGWAKHAVADLAFRKEVTLQTYGEDKYGRTIADVLLPDGTNANHMLLK